MELRDGYNETMTDLIKRGFGRYVDQLHDYKKIYRKADTGQDKKSINLPYPKTIERAAISTHLYGGLLPLQVT